eukprot:m51a1_g7898 putative mov34 mpn pad-1 family protein (330) ;mRNA; r:121528-123032
MEDDKATSAGGETAGTLRVSLHPLVILTISDHHTRARLDVQPPQPPSSSSSSSSVVTSAAALRIVGCLLGTQRGREVEIFNCFEVIADVDAASGDIKSVDFEYLRNRVEQFKKVYEEYDLLGWYTNGSAPRESDVEFHKQIGTVNENALFLQLDTDAAYRTDTKELPIRIYESEIHVSQADGGVNISLVPVNFRIATAEAERIGVDHVAHVTPSGASQLTTRLLGMHGTLKMLNLRVRALERYVEATRKGVVPYDHELLRQVKCLCNLLPTVNTDDFRERFVSESNDVLLVTYLATLTKVANTMNELVDKYAVSAERGCARHRGAGFFA